MSHSLFLYINHPNLSGMPATRRFLRSGLRPPVGMTIKAAGMTHGAAHLEMGYARNRLIFREIRKTINCRCAVRCYTCSCQTSFYAPAGHIRHCRCAQKCDTCSRRYEGITIFSISYTDHPFPGVPEEPLAASSQDAFVRIIPLPKVLGYAKGKKRVTRKEFFLFEN